MKAAIIGAGAIGGFYGAALADAGMDVSFIARGKTLIAIREHGLRLVGNTELTLDTTQPRSARLTSFCYVPRPFKLQRPHAHTCPRLWAPTPWS